MPLKTHRVLAALEADDPRQGGFCWKWRERQRKRERAAHRAMGIAWEEPNRPALARAMLDAGMPEAHIPLDAHPWALPKQLYELLDAGIVVNGAGPYGPSPILRAACVYAGGGHPHADDQDYDAGDDGTG